MARGAEGGPRAGGHLVRYAEEVADDLARVVGREELRVLLHRRVEGHEQPGEEEGQQGPQRLVLDLVDGRRLDRQRRVGRAALAHAAGAEPLVEGLLRAQTVGARRLHHRRRQQRQERVPRRGPRPPHGEGDRLRVEDGAGRLQRALEARGEVVVVLDELRPLDHDVERAVDQLRVELVPRGGSKGADRELRVGDDGAEGSLGVLEGGADAVRGEVGGVGDVHDTARSDCEGAEVVCHAGVEHGQHGDADEHPPDCEELALDCLGRYVA